MLTSKNAANAAEKRQVKTIMNIFERKSWVVIPTEVEES